MVWGICDKQHPFVLFADRPKATGFALWKIALVPITRAISLVSINRWLTCPLCPVQLRTPFRQSRLSSKWWREGLSRKGRRYHWLHWILDRHIFRRLQEDNRNLLQTRSRHRRESSPEIIPREHVRPRIVATLAVCRVRPEALKAHSRSDRCLNTRTIRYVWQSAWP